MSVDKTVRKMPKGGWRKKMERPAQPQIVEQVPANGPKSFGTGSMVIVTPMLIDGLVRQIPLGELTTIGELRKKFAQQFETDTTCPLTTGIFLRIVAENAEEERNNGRADITPYWRVVRDDGTMIDKFPGGIPQQAENLKNEGFEILVTGRRGTKLVVNNFKSHLFRFA